MKKAIFIIIAAIAFTRCNEVFVKDISKDAVILLTPYDSMVVNSTSIDFWWEDIEGADYYNLQVVSPGFDAPRKLLLDTVLADIYFSYNFYPDTFECRIYAFNNSFSTIPVYSLFIIRDTSDMKEDRVFVLSPADNFITNQSEITLKWRLISKASSYKIIVRQDSWQGIDVIAPVNVSSDTMVLSLNEGKFVWGVRAESDNQTNTPFSIQTIVIDTTAPGIPALSLPKDADTVNTFPVNFLWSRAKDNGVALFDTLFLGKDTLFASQQKFHTAAASLAVDTLAVGKYFWRVRTYDIAGNTGTGFSEIRRLIITKGDEE